MPKGRTKPLTKREKEQLEATAENRKAKLVRSLAAEARKAGVPRTELERILSSVLHDPHITAIKKTEPKLSFGGREGQEVIIKVSIETPRTRKRFSVRRSL